MKEYARQIDKIYGSFPEQVIQKIATGYTSIWAENMLYRYSLAFYSPWPEIDTEL